MTTPRIIAYAAIFFGWMFSTALLAEVGPHPSIAEGYKAMKQGRFSAAEIEFKKAIAEAPSKEARFGLGTLYIKAERYQEALAIMTALVEQHPNDYYIKNNVAWVYATAKDLSIRDGAKAVEYAQDALLSQPGSYHVWSTLCEGYYVSGDYEKAFKAAEQAYRLAVQNNASDENLRIYRQQVGKCIRAREAMSLME